MRLEMCEIEFNFPCPVLALRGTKDVLSLLRRRFDADTGLLLWPRLGELNCLSDIFHSTFLQRRARFLSAVGGRTKSKSRLIEDGSATSAVNRDFSIVTWTIL